MLLGQSKLPARLLAIWLPEALAAERRRKARQNRDKRCQPNATYLALRGDFFLILCLEAWSIGVTEALALQLDYHRRYERRTGLNFVQKLVN